MTEQERQSIAAMSNDELHAAWLETWLDARYLTMENTQKHRYIVHRLYDHGRAGFGVAT